MNFEKYLQKVDCIDQKNQRWANIEFFILILWTEK